MLPKQATELKLKHLENVKIKIDGSRGLVFDQVAVRSNTGDAKLVFQLDTDEANAAGVSNNDFGELL